MAKDPPIPALARLDRRVVGLAGLAADALARPARCGRTRLVCVDGRSAAGKTALAERLAGAFGGPVVVRMDDLYPGWEGLAEGVTALREQIVAPLVAGRPAGYRRWDWHADRHAEWHDLGTPDVLLVEGVGAGAAAEHASLLVWLEVPAGQRYRRAMARDGEAYRPHWDRWAAQEDAHYAATPTRERADVVVDGAPTVVHDPRTQLVLFLPSGPRRS